MSTPRATRSRLFTGLSARLLGLTIVFVMMAEVLIFVPSICRFRDAYLEDRLEKAHLAILALEATPNAMVSETLEQELLRYSGSQSIMLKMLDRRMLMLGTRTPQMVDVRFDMRDTTWVDMFLDTVDTLFQTGPRIVGLVGYAPQRPDRLIEITFDEAPLRREMYAFAERILKLSIIISLITAALVFFTLQRLMVRPIVRLTETMMRFRSNPEDESITIAISDRSDEIGVAERELARVQSQLRAALQQKDRLAAVGAALSRITHDLRNSLSVALLATERLSFNPPTAHRDVIPRLQEAIERAISLCSQTLGFVRDVRPAIQPLPFPLADVIAEVDAATRRLVAGNDDRPWIRGPHDPIVINADREQVFRLLHNLVINAAQAGATRMNIEAETADGRATVLVRDNGPGLPAVARERLFQPFTGSTRQGGTGLGLVIAREIARAHGGDLTLADTSADGTTFRLVLPLRAQSRRQAA